MRKLEELFETDSNNSIFAHSIKFGCSIFDEMKLLNKSGIPNRTILEVATSKTAEIFDIKDIGVAQWKKANLLVIDGDPLKNIDDIKNIKNVFIDGLCL